MADYSVLMSVYYKDNPIFLKKAMDSIIEQDYKTNDFVIVLDGKVTPELDIILEEYQYKYSFIRLIKLEKNGGLGRALNIGLKACRNELVARMDSDDIAIKNRTYLQMKTFENNDNLAIVGSYMYEFEHDENKIRSVKEVPINKEKIYKYAKYRNPFNHPTVMYKKNVINKLGNYSETSRGEDLDLFLKLVFNHYECFNLNIPLVKYRANIQQYERRKTFNESKVLIKVYYKFLKLKKISLFNFLIVSIIQIVNQIIPNKIGYIIYIKLFRKRYKK